MDTELTNHNILIALAFSANYEGNFLVILQNFAKRLREEYFCNIVWAFPKQQEKDWLQNIENDYEVEFISKDFNSSINEFKEIIQKYKIDIAHTHFGNYDTAISKANKLLSNVNRGGGVKLICHLHGDMTYRKKENLLYKVHRVYYTHNYCKEIGPDAWIASVGETCVDYLGRMRENPLLNIFNCESNKNYRRIRYLPNGINVERLQLDLFSHKPLYRNFTFFAISGQIWHKRSDLLVSAGQLLRKKRQDFDILLTCRQGTKEYIETMCGDISELSWLHFIEEDPFIGNIMCHADCFVSTSLTETQSMAVAEATFYGLPVIQSDIPGTLWNANNPSTLVFKSQDSASLAEQMECVLDMNREELKAKCEQARNRNMSILSEEKWSDAMLQLYKDVVKNAE